MILHPGAVLWSRFIILWLRFHLWVKLIQLWLRLRFLPKIKNCKKKFSNLRKIDLKHLGNKFPNYRILILSLIMVYIFLFIFSRYFCSYPWNRIYACKSGSGYCYGQIWHIRLHNTAPRDSRTRFPPPPKKSLIILLLRFSPHTP